MEIFSPLFFISCRVWEVTLLVSSLAADIWFAVLNAQGKERKGNRDLENNILHLSLFN
jgi:hypothetical protein